MKLYKQKDIVWFGRCQWDEAGNPYIKVQRGKIIKQDKTFVSETWYDIKFDDASRKLVSVRRLSDSEVGAYEIAINQMQEAINSLNKKILIEQEEASKLNMLLSQTKQTYERLKRGDPK